MEETYSTELEPSFNGRKLTGLTVVFEKITTLDFFGLKAKTLREQYSKQTSIIFCKAERVGAMRHKSSANRMAARNVL